MIIVCWFSRKHYSKNKINRIIKSYKNLVVKKVKNKHIFNRRTYGLPSTYYRVATLSKSYITVMGITVQTLESIGQF